MLSKKPLLEKAVKSTRVETSEFILDIILIVTTLQIPGMIRALPAIVRLHDGRVHSTLWGLPETKEKEETLMVGHSLRHQSAVDVSIVGVRVVEEHNYRGTLTSVFPGGARRQRKVEGLLQKK